MRVLKVADVPLGSAGGINSFMRKTGDVLVTRGNAVDYLFREDLAPRAIPRLFGRRLLLPWFIAAKVLWRTWRGNRYDVVEIHETAAAGYCYLRRFHRLQLPPCVVMSYGAADRQWRAMLERWDTRKQRAPLKSRVLVPLTLLRQSRFAFIHSEYVLVSSAEDASYVRSLGVPWERIGRADSGVGPEYFDLTREPRTENLRLIFIGSWIDRKGVPELANGWSEFAGRHPGATLTVACTTVEEDRVKDSFKAQREHVAVKPRLSEDELKAELVRHDVFVLPAWFEGGAPLALLQAAAAGLACVVTEIGGHVDVVGTDDPESRGALMIPPHDARALVRSLERLASEPGLVDRLGTNAQATARDFTWDRQVDGQVVGYRLAMGHRPTEPGEMVVERT